MDFVRLEKLQEKLDTLFEYTNSLKEENRELKRKIYSLDLNLSQLKATSAMDSFKAKYAGLVEERDRLMMERELVRKKVEGIVGRLDNAIEEEELRES
jgi:capsule polysaccharide export protein KpsE/RkpR